METAEHSQSDSSQRRKAFVFPGQGSQAVGMGRDLFDNFTVARETFSEADDALGFKLSEMCFAGTPEELALTENTQPAILTVSIAAYRALEREGLHAPDFVAGHSLGEYSALVAAGGMNFADAVKTVRQRGKYMQEAVPLGVGAMAAILGADLATVEDVCREAANGEICSPANINSPAQIVIAGHAGAIDRACEMLKERGAKRAVKLNVSAPFHCALMMPAQLKLEADLARLDYADLNFPIVHNVDAQINTDGAKISEALTRQVSSPVKWVESVEQLLASGVTDFIEVGPGKVLSGLIRQINREANCFNVENTESLKSAVAGLR